MNILVASIFSHNSYSRGIMPDVLQTQIDRHPDANIFYLTNSNSFDVCYFNIEKKPDVCYRCRTGVKNTLKLVKGSYTHITISDIISDDDYGKAQDFYSSKDTVEMSDKFEDYEVGAATLSTYISRTRDRDLKQVNRPFVKELAINAIALYLATCRFIKENDIQVVFNFNGRQEYVRAVMKAAISQGKDCFNVERTRLNGHIDFFKNSLPHDPVYKFFLVEKYWSESALSEKKKEKIGSTFFKRQKAGESVVFPSYTGRMHEGEMPASFRNGNKNLVLFNSSDDETAAFGKMHGNPFFRDQNEGLEYLSNLVGKHLTSYNLIIRMHPNLAGVDQDYVRQIKALHQKFPNVFVVDAESTTDSYALMAIAEKVITFGSTTGLEANFIRKPVVLLGIGFFYHADYAYKPENKENIKTLLNAELDPKPLLDTLKVGFYLQRGGVKTQYYNEDKIGEGVYFKGKRVHFYSIPQRIKAKAIQIAHRHLKVRIK